MESFLAKPPPSSARIIFFNGDQGGDELKQKISQASPKDLIFLVLAPHTLSPAATREMSSLLLSCKRIKGVIDHSLQEGFIFSQLSGIKEIADLLFEVAADQEYFADFEQRLDDASTHLSVQVEQVKKLHHTLVSQVEVQFRSLKTTCKYAAGDSGCSEFWDMVRTDDQQLTLLISTENSRELAQALDSAILFLKQGHYQAKDLKLFYRELQQQLSRPFSLFLMLTKADMSSNLIVEGPLLSLVNGNEIAIERGELSKISLRKGDKLFIISPGMMKNYEQNFKLDELRRLLERKWQLPVYEFINQVFLGAKIDKDGRFHYHDGTGLIFEVAR